MTNAELITWQLGTKRARLPGGIVGFLSMPWARLVPLMDDDERTARHMLGNDSWAYWVRRGWDDARGADVRQ
jgi:hypothetical protein